MQHLTSVPEYVIKKGRPHGHRYGKKPGDKEYYTANQLKKKCKKKFFQGIHDRFIRDETFRNRMIENGRDEDVCRQWDALADEDHTHHLTMTMQRVISRHFPMNSVPCFLVFPRPRLERQFVTFLPCWSRHVSLMISAESHVLLY